MENKNTILKKYFGYDNFKTGQNEIIDSILKGNDCLGVMPTGAGKSICFQVPALLFDGITIVISPLISLMKDQVMTLISAGVPGAYFNGSLSEKQYVKAIERAKEGAYKIIYVAPERLLTPRFQDFLKCVNISMVAVDEAHCVSMWGQDFRPSYLDIHSFIKTLKKRPIICAFTATATETVKADIVNLLELETPKIVTTGFNRENLYFEVRQNCIKNTDLLEIIKARKDESGIVYCSTRKNVEEVCDFLNYFNIKATKYHAGLSTEERSQNQDKFLFDECSVIVATNAFGMGIDKSNVRYVIHYNMPKDLESYYQEAGRGGRDGLNSYCYLFYEKKDESIIKFLIKNGREHEEIDEETRDSLIKADLRKLNKMIKYCTTRDCLRKYILEYFGEHTIEKCNDCSNCKLEEKELIISRLKPETNSQLFELLKKLRKKIAERRGVPAFVIFSDATLRDMCEKLPENKNEFMKVSGVGRVKTEEFGTAFIDEIVSYINLYK